MGVDAEPTDDADAFPLTAISAAAIRGWKWAGYAAEHGLDRTVIGYPVVRDENRSESAWRRRDGGFRGHTGTSDDRRMGLPDRR